MAKNFSKHFGFLGFDFDLSIKENEKKEEVKEDNKMTGEKYTESEEYKKAHENKDKIEFDPISVGISMLSGYGAFKIVHSIAKNVVKSTPIGAAAVIAFEGFSMLYAATATLDYCVEFKKAMSDKKTHEYNDSVRFNDHE